MRIGTHFPPEAGYAALISIGYVVVTLSNGGDICCLTELFQGTQWGLCVTSNVIKISNLSKRYGSLQAVQDLSLQVERASIFAFLGTNGAGKSTTIGCITTTLGFDSGTIQVAGHIVGKEDDEIRRKIGVVFQQSLLDPTLSVRQNLDIRAGFYGLTRSERTQRISELAQLIGLESFLEKPFYGKLSGGQRRRADIARALIHRPEILFLDEPTAGLDPQSREQVWQTIHKLRDDDGLTVFLTTHYMEETEVADQVSIIDSGKLVAQGTPAQLREQHSNSILTVTTDDHEFLAEYCRTADLSWTLDNDVYRVEVDDSKQARHLLILGAERVHDFEFRHGRMDDVFLALTSKRSEP
ncbi:ABC transporter ATP-binding protein [Paenarthrobacter nitroguajacolicus]|uniref:ABC transporter ATP-binding protein n=1 Tax=Paenarthrobacter nitroguajacolicus TaxID=211146 RepID=UPI00351CD8D5